MHLEAPSEASEPHGKRLRELECMVAEVRVETPDTTTLLLFTGNERLSYKPGHFLTIDPHQFPALERWTQFLEDQKGKREPPRAYSLASAPHEPYLAVTVKEERYTNGVTKFPPLLSPLLVRRTAQGTRMVVTGFAGPYTLDAEVEKRTDHLVHLCAGSGVVPNFSIIKHALANGLGLRHTLIFVNKTRADIIFRRELEALVAEFPAKLQVHYVLTREPAAEPRTHSGRLSLQMMRELVPDWGAVEVYACGPAVTKWDRQQAALRGVAPPPRFLEAVSGLLTDLRVARERVHKESYG